MAYQTGSATDVGDLIDDLQTFLGSNGWTVDEFDNSTNYRCSVHRGTVYVHFKWDNSSPDYVGVYHSLGYVATNQPWEHTNDSGNSDSSAPYDGARHVNFESSGPFTAYHFFVTNDYVYVVVEVSSGVFRHFGFGTLEKCNDWTGGEFCYGMFWDQGTSQIDSPLGVHHFLLDGVNSSAARGGTVHAEGLPDQGGSDKWLVSSSNSTPGNDGDGNTRYRCSGTSRAGGYTVPVGWMRNSQLNLYVPLAPVLVYYVNTLDVPDTYFLLGQMPDIAIVNIHNFSPGDEVTIGSDTWKIFPWVRKQFLQADTEESWNAGVAYKKIT